MRAEESFESPISPHNLVTYVFANQCTGCNPRLSAVLPRCVEIRVIASRGFLNTIAIE